ncbi:hypothetical protein HKX48_005623 [Thoreauomyces humboldtii]|nr:hypothetical protein HKX48_005623 [Thoreauomyces humboldtii]
MQTVISPSSWVSTRSLLLAAVVVVQAPSVFAHEHSTSEATAGDITTGEPIDSILYLHFFLQFLAWGILFPLGMVFGLAKSRWHVPTQTLATVVTSLGWILGHTHKGRQYPVTAHGRFAYAVAILLASQVFLGVYLKLHVMEGTRFRRWTVGVHGIVGRFWPVVGWVQITLGVVAALGFCRGEHVGQCVAHLLMGGAFVFYGVFYVLMLRVGSVWLAKKGWSQEWIDGWILMLWGIVNTFTEHGAGTPWSHKDMQHTSMGIVWWASGALSLFLSRNGRRTVMPGVILIFTGFAFFSHAQSLELSSKLHGAFGSTMMLAGLVRIIEISFVLRDRPSDQTNIRSFQHLCPYLLTVSGTMFMTVTEEQLGLIGWVGVDHSTYILVQISVASVMYLWANVLVSAWEGSGRNAEEAKDYIPISRSGTVESLQQQEEEEEEDENEDARTAFGSQAEFVGVSMESKSRKRESVELDEY